MSKFREEIDKLVETQIEVVEQIQKSLSVGHDSQTQLEISKSLEINVHCLGYLVNYSEFGASFSKK